MRDSEKKKSEKKSEGFKCDCYLFFLSYVCYLEDWVLVGCHLSSAIHIFSLFLVIYVSLYYGIIRIFG